MSDNQTKQMNIIDSFTTGAKKGLNIALNSMLPGLIFAYAVMQIITLTGLTEIIEWAFAPVMNLVGLPGVAITPLVISIMTTSGGLGTAANLFATGQMTAEQITIIFPSLMLQGAMLQYLGRVLSIAGIKSKYYPYMFGIVFVNSIVALIIMSVII